MSANRPTAGVVVVSYKSAALTVDCLASIAAERATAPIAIRCVVIDNASGDEPVVAAAIAERGWGDWARVVAAPRNGGFAYGNNLGLKELERDGRVDFVHLLNPDTVLRPGAIAALTGFLQAHPRAGIAGGVFENGDGSEWAIAFRFPSLLGEVEQGVSPGLVSRLLEACVPMNMGASGGAGRLGLGRLDDDAARGVRPHRRAGRDLLPVLRGDGVLPPRQAAGFEVWYVPASRVVHIAGQSTKVTERNMPGRSDCPDTGSIPAGCISRSPAARPTRSWPTCWPWLLAPWGFSSRPCKAASACRCRRSCATCCGTARCWAATAPSPCLRRASTAIRARDDLRPTPTSTTHSRRRPTSRP